MSDPRHDPLAGLSLVGGRVSLDFANTVGNRRGDAPRNRFTEYGDVLAWAGFAGVLSREETGRLGTRAAGDPREAERTFRRAVELREAIYRIFSALAAGAAPGRDDLDRLNRELATAMAQARVANGPDGFAWEWEGEALDRMLWPVARDAAELLVSAEWRRVAECADDECGWLFVDSSKSGRRRWCDMRDCGNRAKVRRHRERTRAEKQG